MRTISLMVSCGLFNIAQAVTAQQPLSRVEQPVLDPFGVEIKSGRFGGLELPLIEIGGEPPYRVSVNYETSDGRNISVRPAYNINYSYQEKFSNSSSLYDVVRYEHLNDSTAFRRVSGTTGPFETESMAKGSIVDGWFIDKYGVRYGENKIVHPDGREIWGATSSTGFTAIRSSPSMMMNNFGFMIKLVPSHQAVNLAVDYCDYSSSTQCTGLSASRSASMNRNGNEYTFSDASGNVVFVRFQTIEAYFSEPNCYTNPGSPRYCSGPRISLNYPSFISFPGSSKPSISISYAGSGDPLTVTHAETLVSQLTKGSQTIAYQNTSYPFGGGGQFPTGSQISTKSYIGSQVQFSSNATNIGRGWPSSSLDLKQVQDGLQRTTVFGYDANGNVTSKVEPDGNSVTYEYDPRNNVVRSTAITRPGASEANIVTTYEYPQSCTLETQATCNLPLAVIDARGARTDYTYNIRGQILTETRPAGADGRRPFVRNVYTMRTAFIRNAAGNPTPAGGAISMLTQSFTCSTSSPCDASTGEVITTYDYGPTTGLNNLLLRGVATTAVSNSGSLETHRICYGYNYFGERVSETKPRAGLASCP